MRFLKSKAQKALVTAVTMSLVMGVCGSAMAAPWYYGKSDNTFFAGSGGSRPSPEVTKGFKGVLDGVEIKEASNTYGGYSETANTEVSSNTITISGGKFNTYISGGYSTSSGSVTNNTVNILGGTFEENTLVYGGFSSSGFAINNTVCIGGRFDDTGKIVEQGKIDAPNLTVIAGGGSKSSGNTVKVLSVGNTIKKLYTTGYTQNLEFYVPNTVKDNDVMLNVKDGIALSGVESFNTIISPDEYIKDTTITLLSSESSIYGVNTDALYINGKKEEPIKVDRLNKDIQAAMGYDVTKNAINLTTMYKLINDTNVAEDIRLGGRLDLNEKTLNMQQDEKETAQYNTVTVKKLIGTGNLDIDVDLAGGQNDMIKITGEETNKATINLNSIIVRTELDGEDRTVENKVTVIDDNAAGITLNLKDLSVKTATTDYIYTFTKGSENGKLNVTKESTASIVDFIQGKKKYAEIYTYALNKDEAAKGNLGATKRTGDNKVLNLKFNKDISLSGNNEFKGVTVADGYTLKLNGVDRAPGKVTDFKVAAATVEKNGTLDVANIQFTSNEKDIVNNGTLKLAGANDINDISGTGAMFVNGGRTEISEGLTQGQINIENNAKLVVTGTTNIKGLNMDKDAAFEQKDGDFVLDGSFTNAADVTLTNLGGRDGYKDLATAKNKITGQLTNNGKLTLDNTFLTVRYFEGNEVDIKNGGKLFVPENVFDGEATVDMDGRRQAKSPNEDVIDSMSSAVSFGRIEINDIRKRMGDVRQIKDTKGIWARSENGKLEGMGVDAKFHKFQIGSDNAVSDKWRVGGAVSYTNSNAHYNRGSNSIKNYSGAAYGMYTGKDGEFVDVIARVGMNKTSLNFTAGGLNQKGDLDRVAFALSTEVGKTFAMKNNFYIEPQVELTYSYSGSDDFNSNGYRYDMDSSDSFIGRLGFTLGYKNANRGGVYTRLSWLREFSGDNKLTVSDGVITKSYSNDGKESWGEWAIGGQIQASKATYIYADAEKTFGANVNEKYRVNVGLRYSF